MDSGMNDAGTGAKNGNRSGAAEFHGCQALTPETENSTHYFFAHPHNFAIEQPEVTASIHQSVVDAFAEDREMIMAQTQSLALKSNFKMLGIRADKALVQFRRLIDKMIRAESTPMASQATAKDTLSPAPEDTR